MSNFYDYETKIKARTKLLCQFPPSVYIRFGKLHHTTHSGSSCLRCSRRFRFVYDETLGGEEHSCD